MKKQTKSNTNAAAPAPKSEAENIATKALLVDVSVSLPTRQRRDDKITDEVQQDKQMDKESGQWTGRLWHPTSLRELERIGAEARRIHYERTLPWSGDGRRILAATGFFAYREAMAEVSARFNQAADQFIAALDEHLEKAKQMLNGEFNPALYPSAQELRAQCAIAVTPSPVPTGNDFRVQLSEDDVAAIRSDIEKTVAASVESAQAEVWKRLAAPLRKMLTTLSNPEAKFKNSLVGNLAEIAALIPKLALKADPMLDSIRAEAEQLAKVNPDDLRDSKRKRKGTAEAADAMLQKIQALGF
jgi:hypothetical protein